MATIAFFGMGVMGWEMAAKLRAAGDDVRVWNRTRSKADAWAKKFGGAACGSPAEAARTAASVHLMVADDEAVEDCLGGDDGALATLAPGALVVDHSTVSIAGTERRAADVRRRGWRFLQAPMLAGPTGVVSGQGLMLVAGDERTFETARPTLERIMPTLWYLGSAERDAAAFKLMANSILLNAGEALVEFFDIGLSGGIGRERAMELFAHFDPSKTYTLRGARMAKEDYAPAFAASMAAKDARLMIEAARDGGREVPCVEIVSGKLQRLMREGRGDLDLAAMATVK